MKKTPRTSPRRAKAFFGIIIEGKRGMRRMVNFNNIIQP
jgi:hypothetical protein